MSANRHTISEASDKWSRKRLKFLVSYNDETLPETTDPEKEIGYVEISSVRLEEGVKHIEHLTFEKAPSRARRIVQAGDTIVSTVRTYLKAIAHLEEIPGNTIVSTGFAVIRPDEELDQRFSGYALQSTCFVDEVVARSTGVSYPAINPSDLVDISIPYPRNLPDQQKIADFLDRKTAQIDALIAKKRSLIAKLKEKRLAVITQAVTRGLNPDAPLKDSGVEWLGEVPEHWEVRRLKFTSDFQLKYGANESAEFEDRTQPRYIRITDVKEDGSLHDDSFKSLAEEIAAPYLLDEGDILLARSGATVGKSFKYSKSWGTAAYAGYLIRYRVDKEIIDEEFAYLFCESALYWANINSTLIQATIQNFSAEKYANIWMPIPPISEQKKIVEYTKNGLDELEKLKSANEKIIDRLTEYRTALITAAVTGQLEIE